MAQQGPVNQRFTNAANNLSHELLICSSFFYITAIGMMNRNDAKGRKDGEKQKQIGDQLSTVAGRLGEMIGQKPEAFQARFEMTMADLRKEMADNYVNYPILQPGRFSKIRRPPEWRGFYRPENIRAPAWAMR
ncbi:MAG: hypothetical protein P8Y36_10330 [Alphaproteobacteria bacterium]